MFSTPDSACAEDTSQQTWLRRVAHVWSAMPRFALVFALLVSGITPVPGSGQVDEILVLAASSLGDVLPPIGNDWEEATGIRVRFSFDATSRLAPQAANGAPADVFLSADETWIQWLDERQIIDQEQAHRVAANRLAVVVPQGRRVPLDAETLVGIGRVAIGGEHVPAGRYAREALKASGVWDSMEDRTVVGGSARGVLEWVARGEVDAGVVYLTDALSEPGVTTAFIFTPGSHATIEYWAASLRRSENLTAAAAFVEHLSTPDVSSVFSAAGFSSRAMDAEAGPAGETLQPGASPAGPSITSAIRLSFLVASLATVVGLLPAIGLGWLLARYDFRAKSIVSALVLAPLVIPPVVTGFLLLTILGSQSALGRLLSAVGLPVPFTILGATLAAFIVGMPLYVLAVRGAFEAVDPLYEELSWTLGVPPRQTFRRISLPLALPGIAAGAVLAFARSLGEFGATVVLAGNVEGSTRTIPLAVYTLLESPSGRDSIWVLVGASVLISLMALTGYEALSRRQRGRRLEIDHGG